MQSFNKWFLEQFVEKKVVNEEPDPPKNDSKESKQKSKPRKQKYKRARSQIRVH